MKEPVRIYYNNNNNKKTTKKGGETTTEKPQEQDVNKYETHFAKNVFYQCEQLVGCVSYDGQKINSQGQINKYKLIYWSLLLW